MREPLQENYTEREAREEIAGETADRAGETDRRYRRWLVWGAILGTIAVLGIMMLILNNAVETDWQEVTRDADGNRYLVDHLVLRWDGEQTPYAVQIGYEETTLRYKGIPVRFVLEKGTLDCQGGFTPQQRMHLAADMDLLYLEKAPDLNQSLMPPEIRDQVQQYLCMMGTP